MQTLLIHHQRLVLFNNILARRVADALSERRRRSVVLWAGAAGIVVSDTRWLQIVEI